MEDTILSSDNTPVAAEAKRVYPLVEELMFKAPIKSEEEGYKLLAAIQLLVNEVGAENIISVGQKLIQSPALMEKAKKYLPYISMLI